MCAGVDISFSSELSVWITHHFPESILAIECLPKAGVEMRIIVVHKEQWMSPSLASFTYYFSVKSIEEGRKSMSSFSLIE